MPATPPLIDADQLPEGQDKARAVQAMFDAIAPRYDIVNRLLTFGMDTFWRRRTVRELRLGPGARVLDLACGTGDLCIELTRAGLVPIGMDLSLGMLRSARTRDRLAQADALVQPVGNAAVDGVTCGFALRNLVDLDEFLVELARVVRPGGRIALLEVAEPPNPLLRAGHAVYFGKVVPLVGGALSDRSAYRYLPRSVVYLPPTDQLLAAVAAVGFVGVERQLLSGGIAQLITATRERAEWQPAASTPSPESGPPEA